MRSKYLESKIIPKLLTTENVGNEYYLLEKNAYSQPLQ